LLRAIKNHTQKKTGRGSGGAARIWRFPFNIYTVAEASDFKIDTQKHSLAFLPRPIIKLLPEKKLAWPWARKAAIYLGFPFNIFATVALSS